MAAAATSASAAGASGTAPDPAAKAMLAAQAALVGKVGDDRVALIDQYSTIIATATSTAATKDMATRMLPAFFAGFDDETQTKAINAFLDLVEDEDASIHIKAIKNLPKFAVEVPSYVSRITDVLAQLLDGGDKDERVAVTVGLKELAGIDAAAVILRLLEVVKKGNEAGDSAAPLSPGSAAHDRILLAVLEGPAVGQFRGNRAIRGEAALATARAMLAAAAECLEAGRERVARSLARAVLQFTEFRSPRAPSSAAAPAAAAAAPAAAADAEADAEPAAGPSGLADLLADVSGAASVSASDASAVARVLFFADVARRQRGAALEASVLALSAAGTLEGLEADSQGRVLAVIEGMSRGADAARARELLPVVASAVRRVCHVAEADEDADAAAAAAAASAANVSFGSVEKALLAFHRLARAAPQEASVEVGLDFLAAKKRSIGFTGQPAVLSEGLAMDAGKRVALTTALRRLREQSAAAVARLEPVQRALARDASLYKGWADAATALLAARRQVDLAEAAAAVRKAHAAAVTAATEAAVEAAGLGASEEDKKAAAAAAAAAVPLELPRASDIPVPEPLAAELAAAQAKAADIAAKLTQARTALDVCRSVARLIEPLLKTDPATVSADFEPSYDRKQQPRQPGTSSSSSSSSSSSAAARSAPAAGAAAAKRGRSNSVSGKTGRNGNSAGAGAGQGKGKGVQVAVPASSTSAGNRRGAAGNQGARPKGKGGSAPAAKRPAPAKASGGRRR